MIHKVGNEWRWVQKHSCGHTTQQAVYGGSKPQQAMERLRKTLCPRCNLADLLRENYGERADEDIAALMEDEP